MAPTKTASEPKMIIRRYISISATLHLLRTGELFLLDPQTWDDRNDRYFMSLYKAARQRQSLYALCGTLANETYHHWRVFTGSSDGACLEIHRLPFEAHLRTLDGVRFGPMEYLDLKEMEQLGPTDADRLPFLKRLGFKAENEYRVIADSNEPQAPAMTIPVDLSWVGRVHINPWLPQTLADSVKATLRSIPGCEKLSVTRSALIENTRWKRAGDIVAGQASAATATVKSLAKDL